MINIYKNICVSLYHQVWVYSKKEEPATSPDLSWLTPDMLSPGDVLIVRLKMPKQIKASQPFAREYYKHGAIVLGSNQLLDFRIPQVQIVSLEKFLKPCLKLTVIKLRNPPKNLKQSLISFSKNIKTEKFHPWLLGFSVYFFISLQYFKILPPDLQENKQLGLEIIKYGTPMVGCISAILQPWVQFIPEIKTAYRKYYDRQQFPVLTVDPFFLFIKENPQLFQILSPPPEDELTALERLYAPISKEEAYNPIHKKKNFRKHANILVLLAEIVDHLSNNPKVPQSLAIKLKRTKQLMQQLSKDCFQFISNDSAKKNIMKTSKEIIKLNKFDSSLEKDYSPENKLKEIEEELAQASTPRPSL